jgi:hypothetical protein
VGQSQRRRQSRREATASAGRPVGQGGAVWRDAGVGAKMPDGFRVQICFGRGRAAVGIRPDRGRCCTSRSRSIYVLRGMKHTRSAAPGLDVTAEAAHGEETAWAVGRKAEQKRRDRGAPYPSRTGSAEGFSA